MAEVAIDVEQFAGPLKADPISIESQPTWKVRLRAENKSARSNIRIYLTYEEAEELVYELKKAIADVPQED